MTTRHKKTTWTFLFLIEAVVRFCVHARARARVHIQAHTGNIAARWRTRSHGCGSGGRAAAVVKFALHFTSVYITKGNPSITLRRARARANTLHTHIEMEMMMIISFTCPPSFWWMGVEQNSIVIGQMLSDAKIIRITRHRIGVFGVIYKRRTICDGTWIDVNRNKRKKTINPNFERKGRQIWMNITQLVWIVRYYLIKLTSRAVIATRVSTVCFDSGFLFHLS